MKKILLFLFFLTVPHWAGALEGPKLDSVSLDVHDQISLRRGARLYADYCLGCHSMKYLRYSRMAHDLGMSENEVKKDFLYGAGKVTDVMKVSLKKTLGEKWFGVSPPDLSLIVRARGADWVYTYLRGFYQDPKRTNGDNNLVFKDVAMPNALWELQGIRKAVYAADGATVARLETVQKGRMTAKEFDRAVADLVNFMAYAAEPAQLERSHYGKYVLLYLLILAVLFYRLKKEYWRDVDGPRA
jgi:ubiquinol-cytochrome c reductase cytochrome c1 subunit